MTQFEINRLECDPKDPAGRFERLKTLGSKLFHNVFTPDIQKIWKGFKEKCDFLILCIRIAPEAGGLEILPWETLHDGEEFLSAGAKTGVCRLPLDIALQNELPAVPSPLKMFALMSSPLDLTENERLAIEREQEILLQAVNTPVEQGRLDIEFEDEAKLPVVEKCLEDRYQIFHYSGHGIPPEDGGGLLLEDALGKKRAMTVTEVLQMLQKGEKDLRLAVISGCQTARTLHVSGFRDLARGLVQRNIPAVLAMQFSISDDAGLLFAETLYPSLIEGQMLEIAVSASRRILLQSDSMHVRTDAFAPVLFLSNSLPLQTTTAEVTHTETPLGIDFSFHLPLPQLDYSFYGRRKECREIRDGLIHQNHRAIIVHGIGGIGKTALISHTALRLRLHFKGIYAFDCRKGGLSPETILLELHRYLERQGASPPFQPLLHQSMPPDQLASYTAQVLSQRTLLIIFDNFEEQLKHNDNGIHEITNENLRLFLATLIKTTARGSRFHFTTRYLFDIDEKRIGTIHTVPLGDLNRPESLGLMQKLPNLSNAPFEEKLSAFKTFGGHPYALVTLDRHCRQRPLRDVLVDAEKIHTELREFLALEMSYNQLSERNRELLNRLAAFREPANTDMVQWVMGEKVVLTKEFLEQIDRKQMPEEMQTMNDEEIVRILQDMLPEQRRAVHVDQHIDELIDWGLLTPMKDDGQTTTLSVHSLVRDFCHKKQSGESEIWRKYLRDAAAYYTNNSKLVREDDKSIEIVRYETEAFELLFEAEDFEKAASLLLNSSELLSRWGYDRYLESLYHRTMLKVNKKNTGYAYA